MKTTMNISFIIIVAFAMSACRIQKSKGSLVPTYDSVSKLQVYDFVPELPEFTGGKFALMQYVGRHYHQIKGDTQGSFLLYFVVTKTGKIEGVRIGKKTKDEYTDEEKRMIKVYESMPRWNPGRYKGKKVNVLWMHRMHIHLE